MIENSSAPKKQSATERHTQRWLKGDIMNVSIENVLQKFGLSGLSKAHRPEGMALVEDIPAFYHAWGPEHERIRPQLKGSPYLKKAGTTLVEWAVAALVPMWHSGHSLKKVFAASIVKGLLAMHRDVAGPVEAEVLAKALLTTGPERISRAAQRGPKEAGPHDAEKVRVLLDFINGLLPARERMTLYSS